MKLTVCDNTKCAKVIKDNTVKITIQTNRETKEIDLCEDCYNKLIKLVNNELSINFGNTSSYTINHKDIKVSTPIIEENKETEEVEEIIETVKTEEEIEESTEEIEDNTEETEKSTEEIEENTENNNETINREDKVKHTRNKHKPTLSQIAIEKYGEDKLKQEYLDEDLSIDDLATRVGISRPTLVNYFKKLGIKKETRRTRVSLADRYGIDKIKKEYLEDNISIDELANRIGMKKSSLVAYLKTRGIRKKKPRTTEETANTSEVKDNKIDIDLERMNPKLRSLLKSHEKKTEAVPEACRTCGYRNKENNYCWYTMVTNKPSNANGIECEHYVDIREI